ncbi:actin-like [Anthonomus grandis grandis]|uniref:actin-like n=1 Tax=Anthonomus grandis grandis TaxID=2921223 RepID=UPI0021662203|nr:actin-like [Anthonomus grandis grandis]
MDDLKPTIVLDIGSGDTKAGLADNYFPLCTIPTKSLENAHLVEHGIIQNFEHVERLIEHVFNKELQVRAEEHPVLVTQPPKNPQRDKEKLAEILFEKFHVPALYEEVHSVLTFYSSGRQAGLIVESGHGVTTVVPILSGYAISEAILRLDIGGGSLDQYLGKIYEQRTGETLGPEEARLLKENLCFVPNLAKQDSEENECYTLPDGRNIILGSERFQATDPLFQPALVEQYDLPGLSGMIYESIFKCGFDLRRDFASNIILSGGNTLLKGLEPRLIQDLEKKVPPSMKINIISDPDRKIFVWRGGSILGSLSTFPKNICVQKTEYDEIGTTVIRKKCMSGL